MKYIFLIIISFFSINCYSQREITINTNSIGYSEENAINNSVVNSLNEIFGVFYSSNISLLNDSLLSNEYAKINHGNLKELKINSSEKIDNNKWLVNVTLKISLDEIEKFYEKSGHKINFEGNLYSFNIQLQDFNEINEYKSIVNLIEICNDLLNSSFNYTVDVSDPISIDDISENWLLNFKINAFTNSNIKLLNQVLNKNLNGISLTDKEINDYKNLNKEVYQISLTYDSINYIYTLRNEYSFYLFESFINSWDSHVSSFDLKSNSSVISGNLISSSEGFKALNNNNIYLNSIYIKDIKSFSEENKYNQGNDEISKNLILNINIPNIDSICGIYSIYRKITRKELELIDNFTITSNNKIRFKYGGFVISEYNGHGLILMPIKIEHEIYENGFKPLIPDFKYWNVPTITQFEEICNNIFANNIFKFNYDEYLSSSEGELSIISIKFYECSKGGVVWVDNQNNKTYHLEPYSCLSTNQTAYIEKVVFVRKF